MSRSTSVVSRLVMALAMLLAAPACGDEGGGGEAFPLFGLERGEICDTYCERLAECRPDGLEETYDGDLATCVAGCQELLDTAWATTSRPDCGRAIDSYYACYGTYDCAEFEAGYTPDVEPVECAEVDATFYDLCIF